jgi:hypothetical protein
MLVPVDVDLRPLETGFPVPEFEEGKVHKLDVCSCACEEVTVSLSASCCFEKDSCSGSSITARGDGTVSASLGGGGTCCGPYTVLLNGSSSPINVSHGDGVGVSVTPTGAGCGCANTGCNLGEFPECDTSGGESMMPIYLYDEGQRLILNEKALMQRIRNIKKKERLYIRKQVFGNIAPKITVKKRRPRKP